MRPPPTSSFLTPLVAAAGALLGAGATWVLGGGRPAPTADGELEARVSELARRVEELERERGSTTAAALATSPGARSVAGGVDPQLVARLVEEQLRTHGVAQEPAQAPAGDGTLSADQALLALRAIPPGGDRSTVWDQIRQAGQVDAVVACYERVVAEDPRNADARVELGLAYVQKMLSMPDGPERAKVGEQIDQAFTDALAIDPTHWQARFRKAEGLSYWPQVAGKTGEAIEHFETLVQQQDNTSPQPEQARTYLYLGNLYERQGQLDKAAAIWAKGAQRHPGHAELQQRLRR